MKMKLTKNPGMLLLGTSNGVRHDISWDVLQISANNIVSEPTTDPLLHYAAFVHAAQLKLNAIGQNYVVTTLFKICSYSYGSRQLDGLCQLR